MSPRLVRPTPIPSLPALLVAVVLGGAGLPAQAGPAGWVVSSSGETALVRDGYRASPLRASASVSEGDKLVTGPDGRLELRFDDDATISIGPGSEFRIEAWRFDAQSQRSFFSLARGMIRQVSGRIGKRDPADYRLTTPTGVLAIRGTVFDALETRCPSAGCEPGRRAGLAVKVIEGRVAVSSDAGAIEVPAGRAAFVGQPAERPVLVDPVTLLPAGSRGAGTAAPAAMAGGTSPAAAPAGRSATPSDAHPRRSHRFVLGGDGAWLGGDEPIAARRDGRY